MGNELDEKQSSTAWFHCFSGVAGDMVLGSLIDAGARVEDINAMLSRLALNCWHLDTEPTQRCGIGATHALVSTDEDESIVRTYANIVTLIEEAGLPERVRHRSQLIFRALAEVESKIHDRPISSVHFHEVGGIDSIIDIVGTCAALELLAIDQIVCSPIAQGQGLVAAAHGLIPNPSPAAVALLATRQAPTYGTEIPLELTTPTGSAIMAVLADHFGPMPSMNIHCVGYGAGTRDIDGQPNVVQVVIGKANESIDAAHTMNVLHVNLDDLTGEVLAHVLEQLLARGAADAWITPIVMKKGRPAYTLSAMCDPSLTGELSELIIDETGTHGLRVSAVNRWTGSRNFEEVSVDGMSVRIKVGPGRAKAEFDDAAKVARRTGAPLREVLARAEQAWKRTQQAQSQHPTNDE